MKKLTLAQLAAIYAVYKDLDPKTKTVRCCTCGKTIQINEIEDCYRVWGHYIARSIEPKLIYHPLNSFAQCISCNVYADPKEIQKKYDNFMSYRFGSGIRAELIQAEKKDEDYYKNYYTIELLKLSSKFPELLDIVVNSETGEVNSNIIEENNIEKQFNTFSATFKADLDTLCKAIGCEYVEYNRL